MKNPCAIVPLLVAAALTVESEAASWKMQSIPIATRWAASVDPEHALPEYPRPQLVRKDWQNLNGLWDYAITSQDAGLPLVYSGKILVPYPVESALSGVKRQLQPGQRLWYRRIVHLTLDSGSRRTLLHFGAADYEATVYVNGREVGSHTGGYQHFTVELTGLLRSGDNELVVKMSNPVDSGPNPHGKQTLHPQGIMYTATSGLWQTVWLEMVPNTFIEDLVLTPDVDHRSLAIETRLQGDAEGVEVEAVARSGSNEVARAKGRGALALTISHPRLWSPSDPFLYDLDVRLVKDGQILDHITSYFGLRKIEVRKDEAGVARIFLNGKYTYNLGVLDQGFWPEGAYTAPTDAALRFDVATLKAMGFNTIRKHVKIEPDRWYYHCDELGMLVWQDMVPPGNDTAEGQTEFERETRTNIQQLYNHPCITTWVLFNEGWGVYDQARLNHWIKVLDPTRLLDAHSGPYDDKAIDTWMKLHADLLAKADKGDPEANKETLATVQSFFDTRPVNWLGGDLTDRHHYPDPALPPLLPGLGRVVGECGGFQVIVKGHLWDPNVGFGYGLIKQDQLAVAYARLVDQLKTLEHEGASGSIYTQPYDVEGEENGLMTYDRKIMKVPVQELARLNRQLLGGGKGLSSDRRKTLNLETVQSP